MQGGSVMYLLNCIEFISSPENHSQMNPYLVPLARQESRNCPAGSWDAIQSQCSWTNRRLGKLLMWALPHRERGREPITVGLWCFLLPTPLTGQNSYADPRTWKILLSFSCCTWIIVSPAFRSWKNKTAIGGFGLDKARVGSGSSQNGSTAGWEGSVHSERRTKSRNKLGSKRPWGRASQKA